MKAFIQVLFGLLSTAFAVPTSQPTEQRGTPTVNEVTRRQQPVSLCSQYAYHAVNGYEILNNLWGKDSASSGSQCTYYDGSAGNGIAWSSDWVWQGGQDNVKSYVYAGRQLTKGITVQKAKSMSTSIQWTYNTTNVRANVAYDIFTAADPNHVNSSGDYELMVWLARLGNIYPISQSGSPIASVTINGYKFDLYYGLNGSMKVYSFLPPQGTTYNSFNADIKNFFNYLVQNQGFPQNNQNIIVFQVGTEAFTGGPAKFRVSSFSASVST